MALHGPQQRALIGIGGEGEAAVQRIDREAVAVRSPQKAGDLRSGVAVDAVPRALPRTGGKLRPGGDGGGDHWPRRQVPDHPVVQNAPQGYVQIVHHHGEGCGGRRQPRQTQLRRAVRSAMPESIFSARPPLLQANAATRRPRRSQRLRNVFIGGAVRPAQTGEPSTIRSYWSGSKA